MSCFNPFLKLKGPHDGFILYIASIATVNGGNLLYEFNNENRTGCWRGRCSGLVT
jgi:hypothetical protein